MKGCVLLETSEKKSRWLGADLRFRICIFTMLLVSLTSLAHLSAQTEPSRVRPLPNTESEAEWHFAKGTDCALCHSFSRSASAMRDAKGRNVAPYDLWSGSMMANSAVDPYWRAALSAEIVATPNQKAHIEEVCSRCHAPMAAPIAASPSGDVLAFLKNNHESSALGKDGVSCTVCHQISPENLETEASFTGGFVINTKSLIYGPHATPFTMPMQRHVGFTPTEGDHLLSSAMCATCHTVITESFNKEGVATHNALHEQAPYLEWRNSIFNDEIMPKLATARSCQSCHVPQTDIDSNPISTRLAHNPWGRDFPFLNPREPFGRHTFAGGNIMMTRLLRDNRESLGIAATADAFDRVIQDSRHLLQKQTARLSVSSRHDLDQVSRLSIKIENLAGHKFPTAYPSRRAWLKVIVKDGLGSIVFESGNFNKNGQITDDRGQVLVSELAGGPVHPHYDLITDSRQVQAYETFMQDSDGDITFALLRGSQFSKDNRLLPQGWQDQHIHADATRPIGTSQDMDFLAGGDTTHFELHMPPGSYQVEATLLFQSLSSRYVAELLKVDTPEVRRFAELYSRASLTPETIATVEMELVVP